MTSIYEELRQRIIRNDLQPAARINIDALTRELGVSQTPIREALQHLEGARLVTREQGRGYATTPLLDETSLRHLFEVRMLIEPWSAKVVAADRAWNPGPDLTALIERFEEEHPSVSPRLELAEHDLEFHTIVHRATGNTFLVNAFVDMHPQLHVCRLYGEDFDGTYTLDDHRSIAKAITDCDPVAAERAMRDHLESALRFLLAQLNPAGPASPVASRDLPNRSQVFLKPNQPG
ncbi:GntR family transcriptional regulator [Demetria terragena]|uniref:GntR family transcriptional regulator n=1 Tax=Demetria terragena TaxID=63959 RepID=UPI00037A1598|nr:GntR family transcriptional regulator [Demetria terragena]